MMHTQTYAIMSYVSHVSNLLNSFACALMVALHSAIYDEVQPLKNYLPGRQVTGP